MDYKKNIINEALKNFKNGPLYEALIKEKKYIELFEENLKKSKNIEKLENIKKFKEIAKKNETFYKTFLLNQSANCLIHAPTQVGKTNAIKDFIDICTEENIPVIVSCDNKSDQLEQFYNRVSNEFESDDSIVLVKASDKKFGKIIRTCIQNNKKLVVFCLDNICQIKKVKEQFALEISLEKIKFSKIAIIHDEGDVITKDYNIDMIEENQSQSHKEWLKIMNFLKENGCDIKRIFVTATPENIVYKYKVEHVVRLDIPKNYVGYQDIEYIEFENPKNIKDILIQEQNRRILEKENGIILYCVDKKIINGQDPTFISVCSYMDNAIVNTYNGNGITARVLNKEKFEDRLKQFIRINNKIKKNKKIRYTDESTNETKNVLNIKGLAIKDFYQICKETECSVIVTIGMDLIARGISFVSSDKSKDALAATTMIYKPGEKMHNVGLCQAIGRITGTARSELKRRLYAPKTVIENYINYNTNQKQYLDEIYNNKGILTCELMKKIELNKILSRPLDRNKLKLEPKFKKEIVEINDVERMKQLINMWWKADTIIGKILRYIYEHENGVDEKSLKNFILSLTASDTWYNDLGTKKKEYKFVFTRSENQITKIKKEAREYIKQL
jgi:hypothetical protein